MARVPWTRYLEIPAKIFSRNGLVICSAIEKSFDSGVMAIVPVLPERPTTQVQYGWLNLEVRYFKIQIMDTEWGLCLRE